MPNAETYLKQNFPFEERETITELNLSKKNLYGHLDLKGFINLKIFKADYNQLISIDFSKCLELEEISILGNELTSLYLSRQPKLETLICADNRLTYLDLSGNEELKNLFVYNNKLTKLNFLDELECPKKLKRLDICNNQFAPIPLTYFQFFPDLKTLLIAHNPFYGTTKDIENLTKLRWSSFDDTDIEVVLEKALDLALKASRQASRILM